MNIAGSRRDLSWRWPCFFFTLRERLDHDNNLLDSTWLDLISFDFI